MFVLFIVLLAFFVARGTSLGHAALSLFIFGIVTLPVGLIGKRYEKRIKTMKVESDDPEIADKFQQYLKQWNEARFQLPE
jgi:O-antigen/teichoic acid export membrane protein